MNDIVAEWKERLSGKGLAWRGPRGSYRLVLNGRVTKTAKGIEIGYSQLIPNAELKEKIGIHAKLNGSLTIPADALPPEGDVFRDKFGQSFQIIDAPPSEKTAKEPAAQPAHAE